MSVIAALQVSVDSPELASLEARIRRLAAGLADTRPLLEALGAELESQTRKRIADSGPAPDSSPWPEWSDAYAATRHGGHKLLSSDGDLLDSVQSLVAADFVETGSNLIYAAIQQFGGTADMAPGPAAIPAREWLGLSAADAGDLDALLDDHFNGLIAEALA